MPFQDQTLLRMLWCGCCRQTLLRQECTATNGQLCNVHDYHTTFHPQSALAPGARTLKLWLTTYAGPGKTLLSV